MLFDLRGSGRRRVVKIVYVTLAILMGGGLVLFGIGGSGALSGGLLDAITESSGGADDGTDRFRTLEQEAVAKARQDPTAATWAAVARARFNLAQTGEYVDQNTGTYTDAGAELLRSAGRAWDESVQLAEGTPDPRVASLMVQAYAGIGELDKAAARAGGHRGGPELGGRLRHAGPDRLPGGADAEGGSRARQGARAHRTGHARGPQGPARPGQAGLAAAGAPGGARRTRRVLRDADSESRSGVTGRYNRSPTPL